MPAPTSACCPYRLTPAVILDKRFAHLTLLLDQGEEAQGPRWAAQERKFHDLGEVLAALPDSPALVLLGPPGSGKSTLLRHFELDNARNVMARRSIPCFARTIC